MKKLLTKFIVVLLILVTALLITLSTIGIETNKFNRLIKEKISKEKKINIELKTIKFKIDPKKLSLFLETDNPNINYLDLTIPVQNLKVYVDVLSFLKSKPKIDKIYVSLEELNVTKLNNLSKLIKPSNFKSFLNNKIKYGKLISEIEIYLDEEGNFKNFIAKGTVRDLQAAVLNNLTLTKTKFSFFADKNDILVKSIFGNFEDIEIFDGDIKVNFENGIKLNSNFNSSIRLNKDLLKKYKKFHEKNDLLSQLSSIDAVLNNNFYITI